MLLSTTFLKYCALARLRLQLADLVDHRVDVVDQLGLVEADLADDAVDVAAGVVAEFDLAGGVFLTALPMSGVTVPALGEGIRPLGPSTLPSRPTNRIMSGRGDGDVEVGEVLLLDRRDQLLPAGPDRAGVQWPRSTRCSGQNAIDALALADAVRQRQRAADHLVGLLGVDAEGEDQLDRLVELGRREAP